MAKCASDDPSRYQLQNVLVERKTADGAKVGDWLSATATTGKILISSSWPEVNQDEYPICDGDKRLLVQNISAQIPAALALRAAKAAPKNGHCPILRNVYLDEEKATPSPDNTQAGAIRLSATDLDSRWSESAPICDAQYPNYRNAIQADETRIAPRLRLNAGLLIQALQALQTIHGKEAMVDMSIFAHDKPIQFTAKDQDQGIETLALVMPLVGD